MHNEDNRYQGSSTPLENAEFQAMQERCHPRSAPLGQNVLQAERSRQKELRHAENYGTGAEALRMQASQVRAANLQAGMQTLVDTHNPEQIRKLQSVQANLDSRARAWQASLAKAADVLMRAGHSGDAAVMNDIARHLRGD